MPTTRSDRAASEHRLPERAPVILHQHRHRAPLQRLREELVAFGLEPGHGDEERAGLHAARVVGDRLDLHIAGALDGPAV